MIITMERRGFTIVELLIVIFIVGALLVLGVANLRSSQANGRDSERKIDVEAISLHLESFYRLGTNGSISTGEYPSTALTTSEAVMTQVLRDVDIRSLKAPGIDNVTDTLKPATNAVQTTVGVLPQPTIDQYIYQPIDTDGLLCTTDGQECRKYNIYYRLEIAHISENCPDPGYICMIKSKNQ
jgi:prepilin-type N-terminal cleavage/methylation domain-containing protein